MADKRERFYLEIGMQTAAFKADWSAELARILRHAADGIEEGISALQLSDANGTAVGRYWIEEELDDEGGGG